MTLDDISAEIPSEFSQIENATPLPVNAANKEWVTTLDAVIVNGQRLSGHGLGCVFTLLFIPPCVLACFHSSRTLTMIIYFFSQE
jgi:hypothetical protein